MDKSNVIKAQQRFVNGLCTVTMYAANKSLVKPFKSKSQNYAHLSIGIMALMCG